MTLKNKICDLLDTDEKGYVTIGDIGYDVLCMGILILIVYVMYNSIFILGSIILSPKELMIDSYGIIIIQNFSGRMSILDLILGIVGAALIVYLFIYIIAVSFLWFMRVRVIMCNTKNKKG